MLKTTRFFFVTAMLMLVLSMSLHVAVLFGVMRLWSALVFCSLFGWITAMICGVNYHTMPVFTGRNFPKPALIWAHGAAVFGSSVIGTLGYAFGWHWAIRLGLSMALLGAILFTINIVTLLKAPEQRKKPLSPSPRQPAIDKIATQATKLSGSSLLFALIIMVLAEFGVVHGEWFLAAEHLITLGWIGFMIVGVAFHMLPRFNRNGIRGIKVVRGQLASHGFAVLLIVLSLGFGWRLGFIVGASIMSISLLLFVWIIMPTLQKERVPHGMIMLTPKEQR
ncbi:MAG: hypothetical protein KAX40_11325 [Herpetosiphon sp.]|nr:hypothetical protein [Herpetosiphon sp.]